MQSVVAELAPTTLEWEKTTGKSKNRIIQYDKRYRTKPISDTSDETRREILACMCQVRVVRCTSQHRNREHRIIPIRKIQDENNSTSKIETFTDQVTLHILIE